MKFNLIKTIMEYPTRTKWVILIWTIFNFLFALALLFGAGAGIIPVLIFFLIWEFAIIGYYGYKYRYKDGHRMGDWVDAILFAVIAATVIRSLFIEAYTIPTPSMEKSLMVGDFLFVSKVNYGTRTTMTPLSFPFAHHTIGIINSKSYLDWIKLPYYRFPGFQKIKNNDVVVFNYPADNDDLPRNATKRPVDKKTNYIKRCIGIAGDSLQVKDGVVHINGVAEAPPEKHQFAYEVATKGIAISKAYLKKHDISINNIDYVNNRIAAYTLIMTEENYERIKSLPAVKSVTKLDMTNRSGTIHPREMIGKWDIDNYGPVYIPKKGDKIKMNAFNYLMYQRAIREYEGNEELVWNRSDSKAYIGDEVLEEYTFKMDYYFMMGDNRHNSADSRVWGFVPEDHVVGKAVIVWFSIKKEAQIGPGGRPTDKMKNAGIRWRRIFKLVH